MTAQERTILDKKINGLTWGIVLTMMTTASGGVYVAFKGYMNIIQRIDQTYYDNRELRQEVNNVKETAQRHEAQIQWLMTQQKNK